MFTALKTFAIILSLSKYLVPQHDSQSPICAEYLLLGRFTFLISFRVCFVSSLFHVTHFKIFAIVYSK